MKVLIACEFSGTVRDAFTAAGHHAVSCDLLPTETPGIHYQGDVRHLLDGWEPVQFAGNCLGCDFNEYPCKVSNLDPDECQCIGPTQSNIEYQEIDGIMLGRRMDKPNYDLMIAHPPCTYLASSGLHWNKRIAGREKLTLDALEFVKVLLNAPIQKIALENPIGKISTAIRKPDQIIQPWQFGHDASKQTCLWLKNLLKLQPTDIIKKSRYANQTPTGQNNLPPSKDRWKIRSKTYSGIAKAMAEQWGKLNDDHTSPEKPQFIIRTETADGFIQWEHNEAAG